jgi:BirA family biotin operon repressor/biotin-[acetyl-CoA-carboxylase] ligase
LSLAAGLALAEAVDVAVPAQALMLKWPNDLMLLGKKLGGILLERSGDRVAIGFGLNLGSAPALEDRHAATLTAKMPPEAFAPLLAASFARLLDLWRQDSTPVLAQAWLARAHMPGTRLTVHIGKEETISGRFAGLEHDGALRLMLDDGGIEVVRAGDVVL